MPAALVALALLSASPAGAQTQLPADARPSRIPVEDTRSYGASPGVHNTRLMADVLREFGYDGDRLGRRQQERLDEIRYRLFPDAARGQRLNRSQAVAVVYVALVYPRGTGGRGGGWGGGDGWNGGGWDDDRDRDRPRYGGRCEDIDTGVYALLNMVRGGDGFGFVDGDEKVRIQARATQVQSAAIARNYRQVADRAADVIGALSAYMPERRLVAQRVDALKAAADQACGDRGQR